jgi:hypothetical protein
MHKAGSARGKTVRKGWLLSLAVLVPALVAITDRGRAASEPLEECVEVRQALEKCFGSRGATHAPPAPPKDRAARDAMRKRCAADRDRVQRACR